MSPAARLAFAYRYFLAKSERERAKELTKPRTDDSHEDASSPERTDVRPKDVFNPSPNNTGVLNFAETGKDLSKAVKQVEKDQGYDSVSNLSQYLIRTDGGGSVSPAGKKLL